MKKAKRLVALLLVTLMLLSMVACGGSSGIQRPGATKKLKIVCVNFGYGTDWLRSIAQAYCAKHPDVSITVENTPVPHTVLAQIAGGLSSYDMFFGTSGPALAGYGEDGTILSLDDVYASIPDGETKTVEEKLGPMADYMTYKGGKWIIPYVNSVVGMVVNNDTMNELYPGGYTLPKTTDEFLALCDDIKSKGAYAYMENVGYTQYMIETWWYQYDPQGWDNYWSGTYVDENGNTVVDTEATVLNQPGKLEALKMNETLLNLKNGYNHKYCMSMDFAEAQMAFLGHGYGDIDNKKVAFMPNGAWLENEMELVLQEASADFEMFRVPIISSIINVLPDKSVENDAELSALVAAIDAGNTALSGTGYDVTQNDYDRVKQARFSAAQNTSAHTAAVIGTTKYPEEAKDFLVYLASDEASAIAARVLKGVTLPFGYTPTAGKGYEISKFVQSAINVTNGSYAIGHPTTVPVLNNLAFSKLIPGALTADLINGNKTAQQIYDDDYNWYKNEWKYIINGIEQ